MRFINKIIAASVGAIAAQGLMMEHAWPSSLKISRITVVSAEPSEFLFPNDLNPNRKLKYPSIANMRLTFLSIGKNDEVADEPIPAESENGHAVYTFNLDTIMKLGEPWYHEPSSVIFDPKRPGGFSGDANKKHITGIFRGALLQQSQKSGPNILKWLPSGETYKEQKYLVRDLKPTSPANRKEEILLANEKGLSQDEKVLIRCRKLMNFDYFLVPKTGKKIALLDYYDEKNTPLIELVNVTDHKNCGDPPIWSTEGVFPRFSPTGNFLATAQQVRNGVALSWQLQIHDYSKVKKNKTAKPILKIDNVSLYDVRTDVFKYLHSFSWAQNKGKELIYFKRTTADQRREISRVSCASGTCRLFSPLRLDARFCMSIPEKIKTSGFNKGEDGTRPDEWDDIIWAHSTNCNKSDVKESELDKIIWFSPFESNGSISFAAQVIVKHQEPDYEAPWLTRIAILSP